MQMMLHSTPTPSGQSPGSRRSATALVLVPLMMTLLLAAVPGARAESASCTSKAMYVVAHEDDSLLFQSPALLEDIRSGRCVRTVFLTAGDDGNPEAYWLERERGADAGYAQMAGVEDAWAPSSIEAEGHTLSLETLKAEPRVTLVFMRLPDGGYPGGDGTPTYGEKSLKKLWNSGNGGSPSDGSITAVDGSETYEYQDLVDTLAALMTSFEPQWIATQNYTGAFGNGDHPDHVATAKFVQKAQSGYAAPHRLVAYEDYETLSKDPNVSDELLEAKEEAFAAYRKHDEVCTEGGKCETAYQDWLERQYVAVEEQVGDPTPTALAGPPQAVVPGATVTLDGSASVNRYDQPLEYEWTQTAGPEVALSSASAARPTFTAPPAPATLGFSLVVVNALASSLPSTVAVTVSEPKPEPEPTPVSSAAKATASPGGGQGIDAEALDRLRLSRRHVKLVAGRRSRRVVAVLGPSRRRVWCTGRLPRGARRRVVGKRRIVLESTRKTKGVGAYRLLVHVASEAGTVERWLTVRVLAPRRRR